MAKMSLRHPRYTVAVIALLVCAYWLFSRLPLSPRPVFYTGNNELQKRLDREDGKYRAMLPQRQDLVTKFGPTPAQVTMFPPNQEPWPPYTVWDFFPPIFNCPHEVDRLGALGDGGKWMCGISRIRDKPDCIIYSFGIDSTYSLERIILQSTHHCQAWIYDSTKGESVETQFPISLRERIHFGKLAVSAHDRHESWDDPKTWKLKSLMSANGHSHIDFLRLDIEGWEWEAVRAIVTEFTSERGTSPDSNSTGPWTIPERDGVLPFGQLQIELHLWNQRFQDFYEWWQLLEVAGLRPFHTEVNLIYANYNRHSGVELAEYSFLNIRGENAFIKDYVLSPNAPATDENAQVPAP